MQNRDTNLESPDSIAIHRGTGWGERRGRWLWPGGTRNRIESNRCFQPHSSDANASIQRISLLFLSCILSRSSRSFVPVFVDRSVFLSCYFLSPLVDVESVLALCPRHRRTVVEKRKERSMVGAGNAHAYVRRRTKILLTLWIISNRPLTFSPDGNSTRIFCVLGLGSERLFDSIRWHSTFVRSHVALFRTDRSLLDSWILITRRVTESRGLGTTFGLEPRREVTCLWRE